MRTQLASESARLVRSLREHGFSTHSTPLFAWTDDARAAALHDALAKRGVWTRLFASTGSVRFGLPASEQEWARFEESLRAAVRTVDATQAR